MTMTVKYEFLTKNELTVRGEILNVPEFEICTRAGSKRIHALIEAFSGHHPHEVLELEVFNEAAAAVRARMA